MQYHTASPTMPLSLILLEAIIDITIVDVLNFQKFLRKTLGFTGNCSIFMVLAIAKSLHCLSPFDKLNGRTKRKIEYFSFSKHPFRQIFRKTSTKMTDYSKLAVVAAAATATTTAAAAMTASEQQTGVITRINE